MIEIENARSGAPVLKHQGRWLASSFDPEKEARSWVVRALESMNSCETAIILGLGSGYHVIELKKAAPDLNLVVIEPDGEIAKAVLEMHREISQHDVLVLHSVDEFRSSLELQASLKSVFKVLTHGPSCQINPEWSEFALKFITARDKFAFLQQVRSRPELYALFDPAAIRHLPDQPVSIRTVRNLIPASAPQTSERRLWRILEELII